MAIKLKILVVEDSALHQRFIADVLHDSHYEPFVVSSAEEALDWFSLEEPDLIILDLGLPGMSGLDFLHEIRQVSSIPVIMLTVSDSIHDKLRGFELGADDYVIKPFNPKELAARIEAVLRRADSSSPALVQQGYENGPLQIDFQKKQVKLEMEILHLTATEYTLLVELVKHEGRVLSHEHLLRAVWGDGYESEKDILRTNIYRLRKKLELNGNNFQFIESQVGFGYWFEPFPVD